MVNNQNSLVELVYSGRTFPRYTSLSVNTTVIIHVRKTCSVQHEGDDSNLMNVALSSHVNSQWLAIAIPVGVAVMDHSGKQMRYAVSDSIPRRYQGVTACHA